MMGIKVKQYLKLSVMAAIAFTSCKKESSPASGTMPRAIVSINQKNTEISKTTGITASVVLVGGHGSELATWQGLYRALPKGTSIFAYNRAGLGKSENINGPRDARTIAAEMKMILDVNHIQPPYVFAAHSMGGIYARMFYHLYPDQVKGLVLVDATHENQLDSLLSFLPEPEREQVARGMEFINDSLLNTLPPGSLKEEFRANFSTNYSQIRQYPAITGLPVYVITSTKVTDDNPPFIADIHSALHQQWAASAGQQGKFVATNRSGHNIQVEEPDLVAAGIQWVLSR
jgi:pimeloyl-ACP methyl ester carboxylesterase